MGGTATRVKAPDHWRRDSIRSDPETIREEDRVYPWFPGQFAHAKR